ncbi:RelA/SpoT domain protein [Methanobacterium lacus]|uniref:protein adenylyltransferase n=1 Tax=Methanobacterium lacus (strain AL-21) TaxID=877455 RepID=F0T5X0_METLA|nr:RelA/SpoT domain-containing protein [Methanobacterium lacus]ADZ09363.1 RelA/SpoT domain protein [Methanobacterium lacus]
MGTSEFIKDIKCNRCGKQSKIFSEQILENKYCECGGKYEYNPEIDNFSDSDSINLTKNDLKREYQKKYDNYLELGKILKNDLEKSLKSKVDKFRIECRIKDFDKFYEKIQRKSYKNPFKEIEDICGIRIICYFSDDLEIISKIIKEEFDVKKSVNKSDLLDAEKFGYRSKHFIIKIKNDDLKQYEYQNLKDLTAEIQIRTLLMDVHASIQHKLTYKKGQYIPHKFQHQLAKLSAILELADEEFVRLKDDIWEYDYELKIVKENFLNENRKLKVDDFANIFRQELTIETLQKFLDFYFSDREKIFFKTKELYENIKRYNDENNDQITLNTLLELYYIIDDLEDLENKYFAQYENENKWHQSECINQILIIAHPKFKDYAANDSSKSTMTFRSTIY